ncbi:NYN domain-containing protein [Saccharothrix sp. ALI-22-I]|uniref:NYN domain-containing protein n=1 Tax=Saccharothrix sp. ALI-22-I TaxID=1933778 RepID=UPI00097C6411|nr:NYN domain-containing protein [Saccharothrix sp. ALI-22-I]ONI87292.1 NYN domain-containing protein [Saccharothrix sp. ALI-22-I]
MTRVAVYVDGFNLYFGLRAKYGRKYHWLDLEALATSLLREGQTLASVNYFTARVRGDVDGGQRQSDYLDALGTASSRVTILDGRFQEKVRRCRGCGDSWTVFEEKETDVNIAIAMLSDAVQDRFDTALVVSADSDLCPAVRATKSLFPAKRIIAAFPPRRHSAELKRVVDGYVHIGDDKVRRAQLPDEVVTAAGLVLRRPKHWT